MWSFLLLSCLLWGLFFTLMLLATARKDRIRNRLEAIANDQDPVEKEELAVQSFGERVILPLSELIYKSISGASSGNLKQSIDKKLRMIGKTGPRAVEQWMSLRLIPGVVLPAAIGLSTLRLGVPPIKALTLVLLLVVVVQGGMSYYLIRGIRIRKNTIEKLLPDVLDIITVSVEAGLSFDGAIERVVQKSDTILSRELGTTLKEMRMGKLRKLALRALSERCDVSDLTIWVGAMIQADDLGVGIGNVLRIQSAQMREKRRFRAREKSMKAPIKILFPLVFFIFPSLFIILLGPAGLQMMKVFGK